MTRRAHGFYILDADHRQVSATLEEWGQFLELAGDRRRVAQTQINPEIWISTVFIGLDHRFSGNGPPLLFETMVFRNGSGEECWRYSSWDDAEAGHAAAVKRISAEQQIK